MLLATVVQYNYIIALYLQSCNVIRRFQQIDGVCPSRMFCYNGKLMLRTGIYTNPLSIAFEDVWFYGFLWRLANTCVRNSCSIKHTTGAFQSLLILIQDVIVCEGKQINMHSFVPCNTLGRCNQVWTTT